DPFNQNAEPVKCPSVTEDTSNSKFFNVGVKPGVSTNMFEITFTCDPLINATTCDKAKKSFEKAGEIFSSVLLLNTPIRINASLIPLSDDTILVKQFQFPTHPEYASDDIIAVFNSRSDYYFEDDPIVGPQPIGFLELIVHEIVHGLGFITSWKPLLNSNVTTELVPRLNITMDGDSTKPLTYYGFVETIFDAFLVTAEGDKFSNFTDQLNNFTPLGTKFQNQQAFLDSFMNSTQYNIAKMVLNYSQTPNSMVFLANPQSELIWLETTLFPYLKGSSISHFSLQIYDNTTDFLMTYLQRPGRSLETAMKQNNATCAIGPKLLLLLETIGYATPNKPNPEIPSPIDPPPVNVTKTSKDYNVSISSSSPNISRPTNALSNAGCVITNNYGWINLVVSLSVG
ncbi:17973_t:CDS:2, partial [Racocetra fulgida]